MMGDTPDFIPEGCKYFSPEQIKDELRGTNPEGEGCVYAKIVRVGRGSHMGLDSSRRENMESTIQTFEKIPGKMLRIYDGVSLMEQMSIFQHDGKSVETLDEYFVKPEFL